MADIQEDVKEECGKHGKVVSLKIPRKQPGLGKVGCGHHCRFIRSASCFCCSVGRDMFDLSIDPGHNTVDICGV